MKFYKPAIGDHRVKKKFLIFPKTLRDTDGNIITRWMERVYIFEQYQIFVGVNRPVKMWVSIHWNDI